MSEPIWLRNHVQVLSGTYRKILMRLSLRLMDISLSDVDEGMHNWSIPSEEHLKLERKAAQYLPRVPI